MAGALREAKALKTVEFQGFEILVGQAAKENDHLSTQLADPQDFWFHAAGFAGSHVVVRNPDDLDKLPKPVMEQAARLAAFHSKAKEAGGKVEVHWCRARDVSKPRSFAPGKVRLKRYDSFKVYPKL